MESVLESTGSNLRAKAGVAANTLLANRFLRVPPKSLFKKLVFGTKLHLYARMSATSKAPEGLKDSECEKGNLGIRPPIPYVPPTDLLQTKENSDRLKVKHPNGTVFTMSIFAQGNPKEYLLHVQAVLRLIGQKRLDKQCKKLQKGIKDSNVVLSALKQKSIGP